jgi:hypothetical protein
MGSHTKQSNVKHERRHDRLIQEVDHDPYKTKTKRVQPTVCPQCSAVYQKGRWTWGEHPGDAYRMLCPACLRIRDDLPAGCLTLSGGFFSNNKEEVLNRIRNIEEREQREYPLKRVMDIEEYNDYVTVSFTDAHLTRNAGETLYHAYLGDLDFHYAEEDNMLRVSWRR